jgi:hypothetical protein
LRIDLNKIREQIMNINNETYSWVAIPYEDYVLLNKGLHDVGFNYVWIAVYEDYIDFEYSENGLDFNIHSDWYVQVDSNGKFKGKGIIRHNKEIKNAWNWFLKAINDEKYMEMFEHVP